MRTIKQSLLVALFFFTLINSALGINNTCTLNGEWFEFKIDNIMPIFLKQEGSKISNSTNFVHPICGLLVIDGMSDDINFFFKQSFANTASDEDYCKNWMYFSGTFDTSNCAVINGIETVYIKLSDEFIERATPFKWYKNIIKITKPKSDDELIISAEPHMPTVVTEVQLIKPGDTSLLNAMKLDPTTSPST